MARTKTVYDRENTFKIPTVHQDPEVRKAQILSSSGKIEICKFSIPESRMYFWRVLFLVLMNWPHDSFTINDLSSVEAINHIYPFTHNAKSTGWKFGAKGIVTWKSKVRKALQRFIIGSSEAEPGAFLSVDIQTINGIKMKVYTLKRRIPLDIENKSLDEVFECYKWVETVLGRSPMSGDTINETMTRFHLATLLMLEQITYPDSEESVSLRQKVFKLENIIDCQTSSFSSVEAASSSTNNKK